MRKLGYLDVWGMYFSRRKIHPVLEAIHNMSDDEALDLIKRKKTPKPKPKPETSAPLFEPPRSGNP